MFSHLATAAAEGQGPADQMLSHSWFKYQLIPAARGGLNQLAQALVQVLARRQQRCPCHGESFIARYDGVSRVDCRIISVI